MDDFLEGDDAFSEPQRRPAPATRRRAPRQTERPTPEHRRQIMQRRLTAFGAGILILILLVLGVRGCLDARKTRAFENYANDLAALVTESNQLSESFFRRMKNPGDASDLTFEGQVNADRGTAEALLDRAQAIDTPGELTGGHSDIVLAFELRRDALAAIGTQVQTALGDKGSNAATKEIADDMRIFVASDVLFERGRGQVLSAFEAEQIEVGVPESRFLPESPDYLDPTEVGAALSGLASGTSDPGDDLAHGLGLISTSVAGIALTQGAEATLTAAGSPEVAVEVQNQGEARESDVTVRFSLTGSGPAIKGQESIGGIEPGETQTVTLPISPPPPTGSSLTLEVNVDPVDGEQVSENNEATYTLIFN